MKKLLSLFPLFVALLGAALLFERPAYAYADPGTGLLAIQTVGSALIATGWYLRRKIRSFLGKDHPSSEEIERGSSGTQNEDPTLS